MSLTNDSDRVVVIGAGPAGSACAILLKLAGLDVVLCDSGNFSGLLTETLHPGIESLLEMLGIADRFRCSGFSRHCGFLFSSSGNSSFQSYGHGWLGHQVERPRLREMLWDRAREVGVRFLFPVRARNVFAYSHTVCGVKTTHGDLAARFIVDATVPARFVCRRLGLDIAQCSRKLVVQYGYGRAKGNESVQSPRFETGNGTWQWTAPMDCDRLHWARLLRKEDAVSSKWVPHDIDFPDRKLYAADVTWKAVTQPALEGFFAIGDAAGTIDPASGNGVIRAIMSSVMAAHVISHVHRRRISLSEGADLYSAWFNQLFVAQCNELSARYLQMGIDVNYAQSATLRMQASAN